MKVTVDSSNRVTIDDEMNDVIELGENETKDLVKFIHERFPTYQGWWGLFYGGLLGMVIMAALMGLKGE